MEHNKNPFLDEFSLYLFNEGKNYNSYDFMGAHKMEYLDKTGYSFTLWAPNAKRVSVVGDFNSWDTEKNVMIMQGNSGIWHCFIEGIGEGELYKYYITTQSGEGIYKSDPYAFMSQLRPDTASVTTDISGFKWTDKTWQNKKNKVSPYCNPMNIYEMHLGSWKQHEDGSFYTYREIADELIEYVGDMGYTHIEIMPICEYPFDGSWGYQVTGYYAPTSRYGTPKEFMYFVNKCHEKGIGIIMDWVPAHFPRDAHGLAKFDGTPIFEYPDSRIGEHKEWGTLVFNYEKNEVKSFLLSNALFWLREYHLDGLRVDAVSSMLYRDYGRSEWIPNKYGGHENLEAIDLLKTLNTQVFAEFPNALMIAEESTAWPLVTKPVDIGGLGFNYKWNMGWMNDMLTYMSMDPYFRRDNHNTLTFSMMYAFSENYILPLSHDEVVHGKKSLIDKMSGSYEEKFSSLRAFFAYKMAHPGKKLLFMGGEIAQFIEWRFYEGLEWKLLEFDKHREFKQFVKDLNHFYKDAKPFWQIEDSWDGFRWINPNDKDRSIVSFIRSGKRKGDDIYVVSNFTPVEYKNYRIGVLKRGEYEVIFSSDDKKYGGNSEMLPVVNTKRLECDGLSYSIDIDIAPLSTIYLKKKSVKRVKNN